MSEVGGFGPTAVGRMILDATGVTAGADQAVSAIGRVGTVSGSTYFGLRNLGLGFEVLGGAAAAGLGFATEQALNWESAMARIQISTNDAAAAAGKSVGNFAVVEQGLKNIASTAPFAISNIESVAAALAAQGLSGEQLVAVTREVLSLNTLTGASLSTLEPFITKTAAAFGFSTQDIKGFSSALLAVSQSTKASITDIATLAQRTVAAATAAGISAEGNLALNASLASMPQLARSAGTAMATLITDFANAQSSTKQLQVIADVSGQVTDKIKEQWAAKPEQAIATFIEGLGSLKGGLQEQEKVLDSLGLKSTTVQRTIIGLADAQKHLTGNAAEVSNAINIVDNAFAAAELTTKEMGTISDTTSAQMQILHNNVDLAGQSFGAVLLPVLNPIISLMSTMAAGFATLPTPIFVALGAMFSLVAVIGLVGGTFLILLPRLAQGVGVINQWRGANAAAAAVQEEQAIASQAQADALIPLIEEYMAIGQALEYNTVQMQTFIAALLETEGVEAGVAAAAAETAIGFGAEAAAAEATTVAVDGLATSTAIATGGLSLLVGVLVAGGFALYQHGQAAQDAAKANNDVVNSDESLVAAMQREAKGVAFATDAWILHKLAIEGSLAALGKAGVAPSVTVGLVKGTADPSQIDSINTALQNTGLSADEAYKHIQNIGDAAKTFTASAQAANALSSAEQALNVQQDGVGNAATDAAAALQKQKDHVNALATAIEGLANAETRVEQSSIDTANAQDALAQAEQNAADKALLEQQAVDQLQKSQDDLTVNELKLAAAEQTLARARETAAEDVRKAQDSLISSHIAQERAAARVEAAQKAVNQAMSSSATGDLARATNALHDAQLGLINSQLAVSDAQWQLNYLMQEGASARDILDARNALTAAQNAAADATVKVADAQTKVNDVSSGAALAKSLQDLTQAQVDYDTAMLKVKDDTQALQDKQDALAADTAYKEALAAVDAAHLAVDNSILQVHRDTQALHAIQGGSIERNLEQAQLRLKDALIAQAKANTDLQVDQDALNGKFDTATEKAQIFAQNLINLGNIANNPVGRQIADLGQRIMDGAHNLDVMSAAANGGGGGGGGGASGALQDVGVNADAIGGKIDGLNPKLQDNKAEWETWGDRIRDVIDNVFAYVFNFSGNMDSIIQQQIARAKAAGAPIPDKHALGGYFDRPTLGIIGEAGPELLLPLTNEKRMHELLSMSGVASYLNSDRFARAGLGGGIGIGSSSGSSSTVNQGDNIQLTAITNASAEEIIDELRWYKRTRTA